MILSSLLFFLMCTNSSVSTVYASNQCEDLSFEKKKTVNFVKWEAKLLNA